MSWKYTFKCVAFDLTPYSITSPPFKIGTIMFSSGVSVQVVPAEWGPISYACAGVGGT